MIQDFRLIEEEAGKLGLVLNHSKSEAIAKDDFTRYARLENYPDFSIGKVSLLGPL